MRNKSVVTEAKEIQLAIDLIKLGARLQLLEAETKLSHERLLKLYKEVKGVSPPKGMLPFSTDWFISWMPNIHASLFLDIYRYLTGHTELRDIEALIKAYRLYLEHIEANGMSCELSITRAWRLVHFYDVKMLKTTPCTKCGGEFVVHALDLHRNYVCGLCCPPSRAGKTKKRPLPADAPRLAA
jgi:flagellar transcriptional activator FlhC